jgi:hypothetical protein
MLLQRITTTPPKRFLINNRFLVPLPALHLRMSTLSPAEREKEVIENLNQVRQTVEQVKGSNVVCIQNVIAYIDLLTNLYRLVLLQ